jgi:hypothetical protein
MASVSPSSRQVEAALRFPTPYPGRVYMPGKTRARREKRRTRDRLNSICLNTWARHFPLPSEVVSRTRPNGGVRWAEEAS